MRASLKVLAVTATAFGLIAVGAGSASAETIYIAPAPAGPCSDLPNGFVESGGRVGVDLTIKCFE